MAPNPYSPVFLVKGKLYPPAQIDGPLFTNQTVIVTGSNTGIGYCAALKYVELGAATVILAVRNLEKGQVAKQAIESKTQRPGVVQVWELNMDRFASVDAFAQRVDRELPHLDIALLNAGVISRNYKLSSEGWETTLQVNVLSTALLSILLLPKLTASSTPNSPSHLTIVASAAHAVAKPKPATAKGHDLLTTHNKEAGFDMGRQYDVSKLFIMWINRALADLVLAPDDRTPTTTPRVIINDVCPGACRSDITRDFDNVLIRGVKSVVMPVLFRTAEQGSRTLVGATALGRESHGRYWTNDALPPPAETIASNDSERKARELFDEVVEILKERVPRTESILRSLSE
ncbi:hypothetical protein MMC20_003737 [Loxospora ochrophaea]|nr:hypothetical protein [Loxospora ochrophaea]